MKAVAPLPHPVTLADIKAEPRLNDMALVKLSRLSVQPVTATERGGVGPSPLPGGERPASIERDASRVRGRLIL